jgi:hypothetical protein
MVISNGKIKIISTFTYEQVKFDLIRWTPSAGLSRSSPVL